MGLQTCPECGTTINCGTGGFQNLKKRHQGGKSCREAKLKRDRDAKKMKNGSLLSFLKPKPIPVPSTVRDAGPSMIFSARAQPTLAIATPHQLLKPQSRLSEEHGQPILALQKTGNELIRRLERIVRSLSESTPVASRQDRLAAFNIEPELLGNPNIEPNDLWELVINGFLKEHLRWGEEADIGKMIHRGEFGMAGVLHFASTS